VLPETSSFSATPYPHSSRRTCPAARRPSLPAYGLLGLIQAHLPILPDLHPANRSPVTDVLFPALFFQRILAVPSMCPILSRLCLAMPKRGVGGLPCLLSPMSQRTHYVPPQRRGGVGNISPSPPPSRKENKTKNKMCEKSLTIDIHNPRRALAKNFSQGASQADSRIQFSDDIFSSKNGRNNGNKGINRGSSRGIVVLFAELHFRSGLTQKEEILDEIMSLLI
jgi:hypothetical protein